MASVENIENDVRKLSTNGVEKEKELSALSQAQTQVQNINNERVNNIRMERAYTNALDQNNTNIAQLTGIALDQQKESQISPELNSNTKIILSKYGYGKPKTQSSSTSNRQVTTQGIVINNKTENKTTNNVQIPTQTTPVVKQDNTGRFKAWLNNEFARQKEQSTIREREFEKRESSLNRSTYKLMDFIKDVGGELSEKLDPRRISGALGSELKALMFLFGLNFLSKNWLTILKTIDKIEKWIRGTYDYFIGGGAKDDLGGQKKTFLGDLKKFLGGTGDENESLGSVLKNLFKGAMEILLDKIKMFFESRVEAVKALEFPEIKSSNPIDIIKTLGIYLRDVLSCLIGGKSGIESAISSSVERAGDVTHVGRNQYNKGTVSAKDDSNIDNTSLGDASVSVGDNKQDWLEESDLNVDGNLSNNLTASIRQGNSINSMLEDEKTGTVHSAGVMSGLENLKISAEKNGTTLVDLDFFKRLGTELGIQVGGLKVQPVYYKYVKDKKTEEELADEGAEGFTPAFWKKYATRSGINAAKKAIGADDFISNAADTYITGDISKSPGMNGIKAGVKSAIKRGLANDYTLRLVPSNDPRPAVPIEVNTGKYESGGQTRYSTKKKQSFFKFYELTPELISAIEREISKKLNYSEFKIGFKDSESVKRLNKLLTDLKRKKLTENIKKYKNNGIYASTQKQLLSNLESDVDIDKAYSVIDNFEENESKREEEFNKKHENNPVVKTYNNAKNLFEKISNKTSEYISNITNFFGGTENFRQGKHISESEKKKRTIQVMDFAIKELGMTEEQAAGLAGNFIRECQMDHTQVNPGKDKATGLAQWLGVRKRAFERRITDEDRKSGWKNYDGPGAGKRLADSTFEEQLKFVKWEMENNYNRGLNIIKKSNTVDEAAANVFGYYEFSAGPEAAVNNMNKHGQKGEDSLIKGINFARDAYITYMENRGKELSPNEIPSRSAGVNKIESQVKQEVENSKWVKGNALIEQLDSNKQSNLDFKIASNNIEISPLESENITPDTYTPEVFFNSSNTQLAMNKNESIGIDDLSKKVDKIITHISNQNKISSELSTKMEYLATIATTTGNTVNINNIPKQKTRSNTNITPWSGQTNIGGSYS